MPKHPQVILDELRALRTAREKNEAAEAAKVAEARDAGLSWEDIANALGRTRSGVWKKYHA